MSKSASTESDATISLQQQDDLKSPDSGGPSGYQPVFGIGDAQKAEVHRWLPVSLIALTTAALVFPIVLLRRQRAAALGGSLASVPPPPRRVSGDVVPPPRIASRQSIPPARKAAVSPSSTSFTTSSLVAPSVKNEAQAATDDFNDALYSAKAFGIATLLVSIGAVTTVWGVKTALGVSNTQEFADRMRSLVIQRMPLLSSRIHRQIEPKDHASLSGSALDATPGHHLHADQRTGDVEWSWPDAEERLKAAFEKGGIIGWAEAAFKELEAEREVERRKRGHA